MITLHIQPDFLFQIHKNHLKEMITQGCVLRFTGVANKKKIEVDTYQLTEFTNFYLFSLSTEGFKKLDSSATIELIEPVNKSVIFKSELAIK